GIHGDGAHRVLAEMLGDFQHQPMAVIVGFERVEDRRQVIIERHVHHSTDDLRYSPGLLVSHVLTSSFQALRRLETSNPSAASSPRRRGIPVWRPAPPQRRFPLWRE